MDAEAGRAHAAAHGPFDAAAPTALDQALMPLVPPGARVAVLEGTTDLHVALHRVARRRGAALVPLPPRAPTADLAGRIARAGAGLVLAGVGHAEAWRALRSPGVLVADDGAVLERRGTPTGGHAGDVRVVLQTSGTTGRPRLVGLTEAMLAAHAMACRERLRTGPDAVWLACLPLHHAGGATLVDRCLRGHGQLRVLDGFDVAGVAAALPRVSHVSLVPVQLARLLDAGVGPGALRCVLLGGDHAAPGLLGRARAAGWPVHPSYGLTEACGQVATARPEDLDEAPGTVGRPLPGVEVRIAADRDRTAAIGAPAGPTAEGRIIVCGPTVAAPGWLDTGDLGHLDDAGRLHVTGRAAERIVTGGENVDARGVERVLRGHPDILDACVVGLPDATWGQRVAAAVVARPDAPDDDALRAWCRERLPGHAVPRAWKRVDAVPRTDLGKPRRQTVAAAWHGPA